MLDAINVMMLTLMLKVKSVFSEERGDVNVVAIVVLIAVAVMLAILLKDQLTGMITGLIGGATGKANEIFG